MVRKVVDNKNKIIILLIFFISIWSKYILLDDIWFKIWGDELLYNDMARSILQTGTFKFQNMYGPNNTILYPLLLSVVYQFYDIDTVTIYTRLIGIIVMSTVVFPTYLLARKMKYKENAALIFAFVSIAIPDMMQSLFTVTEVLAYPLFIWTFYFFYRNLQNEKININTIIFAILLYASYMTKSLNLALIVAYVVYAVIQCILLLKKKEKEKTKKQIIKAGTVCSIFIAIYILVPVCLVWLNVIGAEKNTAVDDGMLTLLNGILGDLMYNVVNWGSAYICYVFYTLLSFGFFSVVLPITYKYTDENDNRFAMFINAAVMSFIGVIVILVHGREEPLDYEEKNIHVRYLFYFFIPYLMLLYRINFKKVKWTAISIGSGIFMVVYVICNRYIYTIRDTMGVKSMSLAFFLKLKRFLINHPNGEPFFSIITLLFFMVVFLYIYYLGWEKFFKRFFPIMMTIMIFVNVFSYYTDMKTVTQNGNYGYLEINRPVVNFINQYNQGEVVLIAQDVWADNEIQTLQVLLEKCVDKIDIDELNEAVANENGKIHLNQYERKPFVYATENGHILKEAKCVVARKSLLVGKYIIDNEVIYEDDYYIAYNLQEGELLVSYQTDGITTDNWIVGENGSIIFYSMDEEDSPEEIDVMLQFSKEINPNEMVQVNLNNGRENITLEIGKDGAYYDGKVYKNESGVFLLNINIPEAGLFSLTGDGNSLVSCKVFFTMVD